MQAIHELIYVIGECYQPTSQDYLYSPRVSYPSSMWSLTYSNPLEEHISNFIKKNCYNQFYFILFLSHVLIITHRYILSQTHEISWCLY